MATWPSYGKLLHAGFAQTVPDAGVDRTPFESGDVKQVPIASRFLKSRPVSYVYTAAEWQSWQIWYEGVIRRAGWFDWTDPDDGVTKEARIVGGRYQAAPRTGQLLDYVASMELEHY